jgi:predicted anti-sigma-YlaC factor YlaD
VTSRRWRYLFDLRTSSQTELIYTDIKKHSAQGDECRALRRRRSSLPLEASGPVCNQKKTGIMPVETQVVVSPLRSRRLSLFHRTWPMAVVGIASIASATWTGFLGYELSQLLF